MYGSSETSLRFDGLRPRVLRVRECVTAALSCKAREQPVNPKECISEIRCWCNAIKAETISRLTRLSLADPI